MCSKRNEKRNYKKYVIECRNFTKFVRKTSNGHRDLMELRKLRIPQLDCATRWGSTYKMILDLYKAKDVLENVDSISNRSEDENFVVNNRLWEFMADYISVFSPLNTTIIKFQEEKLNFGDFYAQWLKCKLMTENIIEESCVSGAGFINTIGFELLKHIERRTSTLMDNKSMVARLLLDPRFQHIL